MKKLLHWLGIEKRSEYVDEYFTVANFKSSIYMSIVIIVLEAWMLISLFYRWFSGDDSRTDEWYVQHMVWYLVFLATAITMIFLSVRYHQLSSVSVEQHFPQRDVYRDSPPHKNNTDASLEQSSFLFL